MPATTTSAMLPPKRVPVRQDSGLKRIGEIGYGPSSCQELIFQDRGRLAAAWETIVSGEAGAVIQTSRKRSSSMTSSAMRSPLDQQPSAVPWR